MNSRKIVFQETAIIGAGELICSGIMIGVFAAFGKFDMVVLFSALVGSFLMTVNYFFMAVTATLAADRAEKGNVAQGRKMIQMSSLLRLLLLGVMLFAGIRLGCNVIALVLPLVFVRPILLMAEFFRKKGD